MDLCALKGPDYIWRANWNHTAYPRDQLQTHSLYKCEYKAGIFHLYLDSPFWAVFGQAIHAVTETPTNPLQSIRYNQLDPVLDGSRLVFIRLPKSFFQFLLISAEDFLSRASLQQSFCLLKQPTCLMKLPNTVLQQSCLYYF